MMINSLNLQIIKNLFLFWFEKESCQGLIKLFKKCFMIEHESRLPDKGIFQDRSVEK